MGSPEFPEKNPKKDRHTDIIYIVLVQSISLQPRLDRCKAWSEGFLRLPSSVSWDRQRFVGAWPGLVPLGAHFEGTLRKTESLFLAAEARVGVLP